MQSLILVKDTGTWSRKEDCFQCVPRILEESLSLFILIDIHNWKRQIITFGKLPAVPCPVQADMYFQNAQRIFFFYICIKKTPVLELIAEVLLLVCLVFLWKTIGKREMFQRKQQHVVWEWRLLDIQAESGKNTTWLWFSRVLFNSWAKCELEFLLWHKLIYENVCLLLLSL